MNVLVYAAGIHRDGGPAGHLRQFLRTLTEAGSAHRWRFILRPEFEIPDGISSSIEIEYLKINSIPGRLYEDAWRQRRAASNSSADVLLNLIDFGPLPKDIPVMTFQRNPNYYDRDLIKLRFGRDRVEWELRSHLAHHMVRRSERVVCPSYTMAEMVTASVRSASGRVVGLHHPFDRSIMAQWSPESPRRILYTGHLMPHKNHAWLLRVFAESNLAEENVELWMTADRSGWPSGFDELCALTSQAGLSHAVRLLGRVPPEQMPKLYRGSSLFVFASAGESFGFPMVEALSSGVPALAYDTPIAREILGGAAEYLPHDTSSAGAALAQTMSNDHASFTALSRLSLERAKEICVTWPEWVSRLEHELELTLESWHSRADH